MTMDKYKSMDLAQPYTTQSSSPKLMLTEITIHIYLMYIDFVFDNRIQNGAIVLMMQQHNGGNRT